MTKPESDDPPPKRPPEFCPWCGGQVVKRWVPNRLRSLHDRPGARVAYVCLSCKTAVRVHKFPPRPLFATKKAASAEAQRAYDDLEASGFSSVYVRDRYARGKCTCGRHYSLPPDPCAIHAPLRRSAS